MLTSLHIENFRGFKTLELGSLQRVNIIVGQNNTGKTGLLEALGLLLWEPPSGRGNLPNLFRSAGGDQDENFWKWLVHNKDTNFRAEIKALFSNSPEFALWLAMEPQPEAMIAPNQPRRDTRVAPLVVRKSGNLGPLALYIKPRFGAGQTEAACRVRVFSTHPRNPKEDAVDYNRVVLRRKKKDVEELLKKIEPKLEAIESLQTGSEPLLYADVGLSEMLPVTQMGQGFNRLLDIYSELVAAEAKVLLIDEIENGLHYSALSTIWGGLFHASREVGVQIFATTHSLECIRAAHEAMSQQRSYDLAVIQLFRLPEGIKGRVLDGKHIEAAMAGEIDLR